MREAKVVSRPFDIDCWDDSGGDDVFSDRVGLESSIAMCECVTSISSSILGDI